MASRVVVVASGETERRAIPHLVACLRDEGIGVIDVRIPPGGKALDVRMAERLVKASWFSSGTERTDKFVILVDTDGKSPEAVLAPFREQLRRRLRPGIPASVTFAFAKWHLEAWFFGDAAALRRYLGRDLGAVDPSAPDEIENPKLHLKQLLGERAYTAVVADEIAACLEPTVVAERSPSFGRFLTSVRNGEDNGRPMRG